MQIDLKESQSINSVQKARFEGRLAGSILFLELFAGSARLTATVIKSGLQAIGVDSLQNKHRKVGPVVTYDLTRKDHRDILFELLETGLIDIVHEAAPCGTGSRAREIALSTEEHGPPPLRSEQKPYGLDNLTAEEQARVESANVLWDFTAEFLWRADTLGCLVSGENPKRSYKWMTYFWPQLLAKFKWTVFQNCCHGGSRPKWSLFVSNWDQLCNMEAKCQGDHQHESWGRKRGPEGYSYATADEAAYPQLLCNRFVLNLVEKLKELGVIFPPQQLHEKWEGPTHIDLSMVRTTAMNQSKRSKLPPLIPEYKEVISEQVETKPATAVGDRDQSGRKLLRLTPKMGTNGSTSASWDIAWGIPWSTSEFFDKAVLSKHPYSLQPALPDGLLSNLHFILTHSPAEVLNKRTQVLRHWIELEKSLREREADLHGNLHTSLGKALKGKRLLLFKALLEETNYTDKELFNDMCKGFDVVGLAKPTSAFPKRVKPALISIDELKSSAVWSKHSVMNSVKTSGTEERVAREVWKQTMEEVERHWLIPTSENELDEEFGRGSWAPARRFGLEQRDKIRVIDDYSAPLTNSAYGSTEKLTLLGIDETVTLARAMAKAVSSGFVAFKRSDGTTLAGRVHKSWKLDELQVVGRLLDLWKAYRGLGSSPDPTQARWTIIAVLNPNDGQVFLFKQPVLAFGAAANVMNFNRVSRAIWHIGVHSGLLLWLNFFDDYPQLEFQALSRSAAEVAGCLVNLLGWKTAGGDKDADFDMIFKPLGAQLDMTEMLSKKRIIVGNKPGRLEEISQSVDELLSRGKISTVELDRLRGRMQFADSFVFGKFSRFIMAPFSESVRRKCRNVALLDDNMRASLTLLKELLGVMKPRVVPLHFSDDPVIIFSDGASEGENYSHSSCGAVIIQSGGRDRMWFSLDIPKEMTLWWQQEDSKLQVVAEAELLPVLIARELVTLTSSVQLLIHFVDNNSIVDSLIKGISHSNNIRNMLPLFVLQECEKGFSSWISRVPSPSNPADGPSRLLATFYDGIDRGRDCSEEAKRIFAQIATSLTQSKRGEKRGPVWSRVIKSRTA